MKKLIVVALVLSVFEALAAAAGTSAKGTTAAGFLKLGEGARAAALGEAYTAAADDATALYWNPAALTRAEKRTATLMRADYLASSHFESAFFAQPIGAGALGFGVQHFSAGRLTETDSAGVVLGGFNPSDLAVSAGFAMTYEQVAVGVSAKYIQSTIVETARAGAVDLGVLSKPLEGERLRLGAAVSNLGTKLKYESAKEPLPLTVRLGAAYRPQPALLLSLDVGLPKDNRPYGALGAEYVFSNTGGLALAGRAGYNSRTSGDVSAFTGASFGLGLSDPRFSFDYALLPFGDLGVTHRVSIGCRF